MYYDRLRTKHFCRWCGKDYTSNKPVERDGFCCAAHKQAHHRAYKKYVTLHVRYPGPAAARAVTPKKQKKRKR